MKLHSALLGILGVFIASCSFQQIYSQELTAKEIVKKADDKGLGQTSQGLMTLTIVRPDWTRTVSLKAWTNF
ncbi:MAG: hypothetical protein ABSG89_08565 [Bacteroidales bacterium]|jgi:hypothetical protein